MALMIEPNCEKDILNFKLILSDENYPKFKISPTPFGNFIFLFYEQKNITKKEYELVWDWHHIIELEERTSLANSNWKFQSCIPMLVGY